jgi:hypothetical protein
MRQWIVLASHDENGQLADLDLGNPDSLERVAVTETTDDGGPDLDRLAEQLTVGEYVVVPLTENVSFRVVRHVDIKVTPLEQWTTSAGS